MEKNPFDEEPEYEDTPKTTLEQFQDVVHATFGTNSSTQHLALLDVWSVDYAQNDEYCREINCKGVNQAQHRYMVITGEFMFGFELLDSKLIIEEKKFFRLLPSKPPKGLTKENIEEKLVECLKKVVVVAELLGVCSPTDGGFLFDDVEELSIFRYVKKSRI